MLTKETLLANEENLRELAGEVTAADLETLAGWLREKDDNLRYAAFLLLQLLSGRDDRVYAYWPRFAAMLRDGNSYQRSLGAMLIAENIRWDKAGRFRDACRDYLACCDDEKFITARQALQGLLKIIACTDACREETIAALTAISLEGRKDTQKNLMLQDIVEVLARLHEQRRDSRLESYLRAHLDHDKVKKRIKSALA